MATEEHRLRARDLKVRCAVVTVSDTRTEATDSGGDLIRDRLTADGHEVLWKRIVPDEPDRIRRELVTALTDGSVEALLFTGGTGIASRDGTPDVVRPYLTRELPGFAELFRMLSYQEVGAAAMLSRALAGVAGNMLVFCLPGSPQAVRLALDALILPELRHLRSELRR